MRFSRTMSALILMALSSCVTNQEYTQDIPNRLSLSNSQPQKVPENKESEEEKMGNSVTSQIADGEKRSLDKQKLVGGIFEVETSTPSRQKQPNAVWSAGTTGDAVLNFVNADIRDVARAVFGDMFGMNYTVAPTVQGNVTLKINQSLSRDQLLSSLDTVFRASGVAIVKTGEIIRIVPISEATRQGSPILISDQARSQPGFGMQIVSLHNVNAEEMQRLLTPIAPSGGVLPVESARNVLILAGTEEERATMMNVVRSFDVDWLSGMSFGLFPIKEASAKTVVSELGEVFETKSGPISKIVKFVSLDRLNAVLVISHQPRYIKKAREWIDRLDVDSMPMDQKIWVYSVQNGRAVDLSKTLEKLSGGITGKSEVTQASSDISSVIPASALSTGPGGNGRSMTSEEMFMQDGGRVGLKVIADETTNSLIIMGTKEQFSIIEAALRKLDVVPLQVRIEAAIAEVTLNKDLRYGIQYLFHGRDGTALLTNSKTISVDPTLPGFSAFVTHSHISAVLDLLQSVTTVHVVSSPQLMVLNNQTATLQVGDQVPIVTQTAVSVATTGAPVVNSIQMKDTGVILKVTPRVNSSGMVIMDISQEVSDVAKTTTSDLDSPTIQQRKISSSIAVHDGETIALGGLIKDNSSDRKDGIPLLQDIPYVGSLFGTTTEGHARTELIALITPRVVRNDRDVKDVTDEMCQKIQATAPLISSSH